MACLRLVQGRDRGWLPGEEGGTAQFFSCEINSFFVKVFLCLFLSFLLFFPSCLLYFHFCVFFSYFSYFLSLLSFCFLHFHLFFSFSPPFFRSFDFPVERVQAPPAVTPLELILSTIFSPDTGIRDSWHWQSGVVSVQCSLSQSYAWNECYRI